MQKHVLALTTFAFILACDGMAAGAQQSPGSPMVQPVDSHSTRHPDQQQTPQSSVHEDTACRPRRRGLASARRDLDHRSQRI